MSRTSPPFELRLLDRLGLQASSTGGLCGGIALLSCLGLLNASGEDLVVRSLTGGLRLTGQAHVAILVSLLFGYLTGIGLHLVRKMPRRPGDAARADLDPDSPATLLAGVAGLLAGALLIFLTTRVIRLQEPERDIWGAGEIAIDVVSLLLLWGIGRAGMFTLLAARLMHLRPLPIDLLNLPALYPAARAGLRTALAWIGGISLGAAIMAFDPNPDVMRDAGGVIATLLGLSLAVGAVALLAPVWQLRARIGEAKEAALAATLHDLRALRERRDARPGEEADLLARNAFLASLPTWPIDVGTLRRFGFYVFFPVASWLCGTVMQRLLDTVLVSGLVNLLLDLGR